MGQAGKQRSKALYDWSILIPQYEELWSQLSDIRKSQKSTLKKESNSWPARMDPLWSFSNYPTKILQVDMKFSLVDSDAHSALARYKSITSLDMVNYAKIIIPTESEVSNIFEALNSGPKTAQVLIENFLADRKYLVLRSLVWLTKIGLLKLT